MNPNGSNGGSSGALECSSSSVRRVRLDRNSNVPLAHEADTAIRDLVFVLSPSDTASVLRPRCLMAGVCSVAWLDSGTRTCMGCLGGDRTDTGTRRSEPYDPYVPAGGSDPTGAKAPAAGGSSGGPSKTAQIQQQIDDTVGIMRENITKVSERGERLDTLQDKTGETTFCPEKSRWQSADPKSLQTTSLYRLRASGKVPIVSERTCGGAT